MDERDFIECGGREEPIYVRLSAIATVDPEHHEVALLSGSFGLRTRFDRKSRSTYIERMVLTMQPEELRRVFRENLRARRIEKGHTQAVLAELIGASQSHVADLERGRQAPSLDTIARISKALETTPDALLSPGIFSGVPA